MIVWRDKLLAFGIHFLTTLALAAGAAALIFLVWFPDPFQRMVRGTELFELVVGCDLALGPLLSLVVFDRRKTRRALLFDYSVIGVLQIAALVYGVYIVAASRPVYVTFSADRLEVVIASEIRPTELAAARDPRYQSLPLDGPKFVAIQVPPADHDDALFASLDGRPESARPKFYVPYAEGRAAILKHAKTLAALEALHPESRALTAAARKKLGAPEKDIVWLPVASWRGFWTALIDPESGYPVAYVDLDPY